jgi:hypothetical protein
VTGRREPSINRALRVFHPGPLIQTDAAPDPDAEPMSGARRR